jgi:hypothetical protein
LDKEVIWQRQKPPKLFPNHQLKHFSKGTMSLAFTVQKRRIGVKCDLIAEVTALADRCKGDPVEMHVTFLHLRNKLPEIVEALHELAVLQGNF